jgi:hypothetical protein
LGRGLDGVAGPNGANPVHGRDDITGFVRIGTRRYDDCGVPAGKLDPHPGDAAGLERGLRPVLQVVLGRPGPDREQYGTK